MEDAFKRLLYAGVGIAAEATEKIQKEVDKLVERGKVSDSEGKKIVDDFFAKTADKRDEFEGRFKEVVEKFGYSKSEEVAELRKRVEDLETKLK